MDESKGRLLVQMKVAKLVDQKVGQMESYWVELMVDERAFEKAEWMVEC